MKKNVHKNIEWFLNFLNFDLSALNDDEKMTISNQVISIIFGMPELVFEEVEKPEMPADRWKDDKSLMKTITLWQKENKLKACQDHLKKYFKIIIQTINEAKTLAKDWSNEINNYFCFGQIDSKLKMRIESPLIEFDHKVVNKGEKNQKSVFRLRQESLLTAPIRLAFIAETDEDTLLFYFFEALKGVPLSSLRQCPECKQYFFHLTKKIKIYCNNNCAAKRITRQRRKRLKRTDPEAYIKELARDSDRSRRYYRKNVTSGIPARRPWKYKNSKEK
jgi:hypothetical protein